MRTRRLVFIFSGLGLSLGLAACGSDDAVSGSQGSESTASGTNSDTADESGSASADGDGDPTGDGDGDPTGDGDGDPTGDGDGDPTGDGDGDPGTCPGTQMGCVVDWAGQFGQMGNTDGIGQAARFQFIAGITSDDTYVYLASDHAIRRIDKATADVTTWAGASGQQAHVDGVGTAARFSRAVGLATDGTQMWVADADNFVIREIDIASVTVSTVAGQVGVSGSQDGMANASFQNMRDLTWDGSFLYLVQGNGVIRRIDVSDGTVITLAGQAGQNGFADGDGANARFDVPRFIEHIGGNEFYIADTENSRPRLMTVNGGIGTISSPYGGAQGYADGNGNGAQFDRLRGLAFAGGNVLVVSDSDNFVLREIDLGTADVTTLAGMAGNNNHVVGLYQQAGFDKPLDMHYDAASGDLFISEGANLRRMYYN